MKSSFLTAYSGFRFLYKNESLSLLSSTTNLYHTDRGPSPELFSIYVIICLLKLFEIG